MRRREFATYVLLALAVAGCTTTGVAAKREGEPSRAAAGAALEPVPRQVIRRGAMGVEVEQLPPARARLQHALGALGGQVARSEVSEDDRAEYFLRVPPDRLDPLMDSVAALGVVQQRIVSADDVTERVIDTEGRLTSLRASRDRLRQLLDRAASVQDVVTVERELARVQGEIESLEGRLAALRSQVALSELSVELRRRPVYGPLGLLFRGLGTLVAKLWIWR